MNFETYLKESLSSEDIKKIEEVGFEAAKTIFKDKYDEEKAKKLIDSVIEKNKDKDADELSQIVVNSFRAE